MNCYCLILTLLPDLWTVVVLGTAGTYALKIKSVTID